VAGPRICRACDLLASLVHVDIICINQADIQEKSQQVSQIGTVYSVAQHTVIYLGDPNEETDSIFNKLGYFGASGNVSLRRADLRAKYSDAALKVLANGLQSQILGRSWFTRVWVFQELLLSRDPWLQCGSKRLKWESLCQFFRLLRSGDEPVTFIKTKPDFLRVHLPEGVDAIGRLEDMISARRRYQGYVVGNDAGNPLLALLALRRGLGVSDARDMIYAHLGVVSDSLFGHLELEVDYSKSCSELFIDVTRYFLKRYKDYRILSHVEDVDPLKRRQGLPSWVPDWTSTKVLDPDSDHNFVRDGGRVNFSFLQSAEGKHQLVCKGKFIRRIGMIGSNVLSFAHLKSDEIRRSWSTYLGRRDKRKGFEVLVEEAAEAAGLQNSPSFRENFILCQNHCEGVLERILTPSARGGSHSEVKLHPVALISAVPFGLIRVSTSYVGADQAGLQVLEGKRLCLLKDLAAVQRPESDEIALVPQSTQVGDFICSLDGEWRNFVFRRLKVVGPLKKKLQVAILCLWVGAIITRLIAVIQMLRHLSCGETVIAFLRNNPRI
jgi:hypothetical protein